VKVRVADRSNAETKGRWLRPLLEPWPRMVCSLLEHGEAVVVRALVAEVRGSAPREPGASMLITPDGTYGTIGGGNLEWQATLAAQSLLTAGAASRPVQIRRLVLSRELGQCCGGVVQLWLERFTRDDLPLLRQGADEALRSTRRPTGCRSIRTEVTPTSVVRSLVNRDDSKEDRYVQFSSTNNGEAILVESIEDVRQALWLYGAGHVAQALIHIVAEQPFDVTWVDSRAELLPSPLPSNVNTLCTRTPINTINSAPPGARFLVMTHDHALDYALCKRILERKDLGWLGLIGSKSKGARFRSRLARDGVAPEVIARLTCPIGIEGVNSKLPAAIAVAVVAQLLRGVDAVASLARPGAGAGTDDRAARVGMAAGTDDRVGRVGVAAAAAADTCAASDCATCGAARRSHGKSGVP